MTLLSTKEAAKYAQRDETTLRRAVKNGRLSSTRNGDGNHEFDISELDRWKSTLKSRKRAPNNAHATESPSTHAVEMALLKSQIEDLKHDRDKWQEEAAKW